MEKHLKLNVEIKIVLITLLLILANGDYLKFDNDTCYADTIKTDDSSNYLSRPKWLDSYPIVMVGNWDGAPVFRNRRGGNPTWYMEDYKREYTEEAVIKLKEMGVTMVITDIFKGFGLEAEKEQLENSKKLAFFCKSQKSYTSFQIFLQLFFRNPLTVFNTSGIIIEPFDKEKMKMPKSMKRKTPRMRRVEEKIGMPLEEFINQNPDIESPYDLARHWEIDYTTVYDWMRRLGFRTQLVIVADSPGDSAPAEWEGERDRGAAGGVGFGLRKGPP